MPKQYRPREVEIIARRLGWIFNRQTGSHLLYKRPGHQTVAIPNHHGMVKPGTLGSIIRQMGLNRSEFDRIANEVL